MNIKLIPSILIGYMLIGMLHVTAIGQSDVPRSSASYSAVKQAIDGGYLSLEGNKFNGTKAVSRTELAIAIDRLLNQVKQRNLNMTQSEIDELLHLADAFKPYLSDVKKDVSSQRNTLNQLQNEQISLNHDVSTVQIELENEISKLKKENNEKETRLWIGIGLAALLGVLLGG